MHKNSLIYVAGHNGLVGSSILRKLQFDGFNNLLTKSRIDLDLTNKLDVDIFFEKHKPEYVFLAAAMVGGIHANSTYPAQFIYCNIAIQTNLIHAAWKNGTKKLLFLGSSCIYPKYSVQPINESSLLTGMLEPTNEWYAVAKIAGIKMCQAYRRQYDFNAISIMPTNLYGPGDNFDLKNSHVMPALIRKFHEGKCSNKKYVELWGSGTPKREFLHVDDMVDASIFLMQNYNDEEIINVGTGKDIMISDLANLIKNIVGYEGELKYNKSMPDGMPRKLLDVSKLINMGWTPKISLAEGVEETYDWFLKSDWNYS